MRRLHALILDFSSPAEQLGALSRNPNSGAALGRAKRSFTDEQAREIRAEFIGERGQITALAERHGLSRYAVATILKGNRDER